MTLPLGAAYRDLRARLSAEQIGGRLARGSGRTIFVNGTGAVLSFAVQIMVARMLHQDRFGTYLIAIGWLSVGLLFAKLELDSASVRFIGGYVATARWDLLRGYLQSARRAVSWASVVVALLGVALALLTTREVDAAHPGRRSALVVALVLLPVASRLALEASVLQGLQQYVRALVPFNIGRPVVFGAGAFVVWRMTGGLEAAAAVGLNLLGAAVALAMTWHWSHSAQPPEVRSAAAAYDVPHWVRTSTPLFLMSVAQLIISQQADILIVGTMLTARDAATYGAASQLALPIGMAAASVTYVAQPMVADLYSRGELGRLRALVRATTWATTLIAIPAGVFLVLAGRWLLALYGDGFVEGHGVLMLLVGTQVIGAVVGTFAGHLLTMTAHERDAAWIIVSSAALNVVLAVVLTPRLGPIGTAAATLLTAVVRAIALSVRLRRTLGLLIPAF